MFLKVIQRNGQYLSIKSHLIHITLTLNQFDDLLKSLC